MSLEFLRCELNDDKDGYIVVACNTEATGDIIIPSEHNGLPVTKIGNKAFFNRTGLTSITIPDSVTSIRNCAFEGCTKLKSVHITDLASWLNIDFNGYKSNPLFYADNLYINGKLVKDIVVPDGVTSIPKYSLSCNNITSVVIPDSVTSIGSSVFSGCKGLSSVTISGTFVDVGRFAFSECKTLKEVTMPSTLSSVGELVFGNCPNLEQLKIRQEDGTEEVYAVPDEEFANTLLKSLVVS